ncbi:MAG: SPFH domain-containing protein, partial [Erysipelotrichaceae bacterium]|nr:SPFH domain-containing protein [Erysipelotrichaceae bacterium]
MGLIKALTGSIVGTALETWKDYFVCDALDNDTLMLKGVKRGGSSSNEIITNGSGIVVNDGQCALVVENGTIIEVAAEPGNYTFDTSISPSVFDGGFEGIKNAFMDALGRFTYGGEVNRSQRVYYVNTKEIMGNMFGTATPIPFKIVDKNINLDVDVSARCNGEYSFKIVNPVTFYKNVVGNARDRFDKEEIASMMKAEM